MTSQNPTGRADDHRLSDHPMQQVRCQTCAATVAVRKGSWQQTSVQWSALATAMCVELRGAGASAPGHLLDTCRALRESIRLAAVRGELPVVDPEH